MFDKLFQFIRRGVYEAILGGIDDAQAEVSHRLEAREPLTIEAQPTSNGTNGKAKARRRPAAASR